MNLAAVNICGQVFLLLLLFFAWMYVFGSLGQAPKGGLLGADDHSLFNLLRNRQVVFHSGCTIFHSRRQCAGVLISPRPRRHLLLSAFLIIAILMGVEW